MDADIIIDIIELAIDLIFALAENTDRKYKSKPSHFTNATKPYNNLSRNEYQDSVRMHPELYVPPKKNVSQATFVKQELPRETAETPVMNTPKTVVPESKPDEPVIPKATSSKPPQVSSYDALARKIEVEVFMIVYMLQQDDGRITRDEARVIKRHVRKHNVSLNDADMKKIKELVTQDLTIDMLVEMMEQFQVPQEDIKRMFQRLYDINRVTKRHDMIISFMRNHLVIQLDLDLSGIE